MSVISQFTNVQFFKSYFVALAMILFAFTNSNGQIVTITQNTIWATQADVPGNGQLDELNIEQNATLTILSGITVAFKPGGHLTIYPGSQLISSATFTATSAGYGYGWQGIEVVGYIYVPQTLAYQGVLRLDGATVEYANRGIYNGIFGDPNEETNRGGIMYVDNTTFRNNLIDVYIGSNDLGTNTPFQTTYEAHFNRCQSIIDDNYIFGFNSTDSNLEPFFVVQDVAGVEIKGHEFVDRRTIIDVNRPSGKIGIEPTVANIIVDEYCSPFACTPTTFESLGYGIWAFGDHHTHKGIQVKNSEFECWHGIKILSNTASTIYNNEFTIKRTNNPIIPSYGLYLDRCQGYAVQYNSFMGENVNAPADGGVGVIVRNQHPNSTSIYNNDFEQLVVATEAIGENTDQQSGANADGLEYRCNNFSEHLIDVGIFEDLTYDPIYPSVTGIKEYHYLTANRFSEEPGQIIDISLYNAPAAFPFRYFHHIDAVEPRFSPSSNVGNITVIGSNTPYLGECPEIFLGNEPDIGTLGDIKETKGNLFNQTISTLNTLVDNGNTPQMVTWVQTANQPRRAVRVYFKIMQQAPFTSDAVLEEVSKKEVGFSKGMIRNILRQHPQAAKSAQIQENLDNRVNQLPNFMRNQINQGLNTISAKEQMELNANTYKRERDEAVNKAVQLLSADSLDRRDEMIDFLSNTDELGFEYRIANIHDEKGEIEQADAILSNIGTWELSEKEHSDYQAHIELRSLIQAWENEGKDLAALAEEDIVLLHDYAVQPNLIAGKAIGILQLNGNTDYPEPVYFPELLTEERRIIETEPDEFSTSMSVYPSPASDYINIRYDLQQYENLLLKITDMTGKVVYESQLLQPQDEVTIITTKYPTGHYVSTIYDGSQVIESKQFIITK